jgi:hypothetical protein
VSATVKILDWRPMRKNSLLGFAKIELPSGMMISDVTVLTGANGVIEALRLSHPVALT